jgi:hypothetical protein
MTVKDILISTFSRRDGKIKNYKFQPGKKIHQEGGDACLSKRAVSYMDQRTKTVASYFV